MPIFFNNNHVRDHARLYGGQAFYDLRLHGKQATMATDLIPGDQCVVATPANAGAIEFCWFSFSHEKVLPMPDEPGNSVRVLFGDRMRSEILSKPDAAATEPYAKFFDINGNFKRRAVMDSRRELAEQRST